MARYVGGRIVPTHGGVWDGGKSYEELTIVLREDTGDSYISKRPVPSGVDIGEEHYWVLYSQYNEQITRVEKHLDDTASAIRSEMDQQTKIVTERMEQAEGTATNAKDVSNQNRVAIESRMELIETRQDANVRASTDADADYAAEVVDARVDENDVTYASLGSMLRTRLSQIKDNDIRYSLKWNLGYALRRSGGSIYECDSPKFAYAVRKFAKGTRIYGYTVHRTGTPAMLGVGSKSDCLVVIARYEAGVETVEFDYTVQGACEYVYFCLDTSLLAQCSICIEEPVERSDDSFLDIDFTHGYLEPDGTIHEDTLYGSSEILEIAPMKELSFNAVCSPSACTICEYDAGGNFLRVVRLGVGVKYTERVSFVSLERAYIRICSRITMGNDGYGINLSELDIRVGDYKVKSRKPTFTTSGKYVSASTNKEVTDSAFLLSAPIELMAGETISFNSAANSAVWTLSEWNTDSTFCMGITKGNGKYRSQEFTADHHMYVRVCSKSEKATDTDVYVNTSDFNDILIYFKSLHYADVQDSPLAGKSITLIGDSLAYGNQLGNDAVWLHQLCQKYDMQEHNLGINGNAVARSENGTSTAMVDRFKDIPRSDYIVLLGGANDKRLSVPIGENSDNTETTFKGALNLIIDGIREMYPEAKLLFLTNYNRYPTLNLLSLTDIDYVEAMKEICALKCVPCFDNYHCSGIYFQDESLLEWQDEGLSLGRAANHHLSVKAYQWISNRYEQELLKL